MAIDFTDGEVLNEAGLRAITSWNKAAIYDELENLADETITTSSILDASPSSKIKYYVGRDLTINADFSVPSGITCMFFICRNMTINSTYTLSNYNGAAGGIGSSTANAVGGDGGDGYYYAGGTPDVSNNAIAGTTGTKNRGFWFFEDYLYLRGAGGGGGGGNPSSTQAEKGFISGPSGGANGSTLSGSGGDGGKGGGSIFLLVKNTLTLNGTIDVSGTNGNAPSGGTGESAGGGGGSGGLIYISAKTLSGSGTIKANGGNGGNANSTAAGDGAGGNGGIVKIYTHTASNPYAVQVNGGTAGSVSTSFTAQNGNAGLNIFLSKYYLL